MWFLAFRYLLNRKKQSLLILIGIVLGTTAYVSIAGMMLGFQQYILEQLVENEAHIRIQAREDVIEETSFNDDFFEKVSHVFWASAPSGLKKSLRIQYPQGWFERLDQDPQVLASSPQINLQVIVKRSNVSEAARFIGTDPFKQAKITRITSYMLKGDFTNIGQTGNRIVVGAGLMKKIGAKVSDSVLITTGKADPQPFKIVGVFQTGINSVDETTLFGSLIDGQKLNQTPSYITDIAVRISDPSRANELAKVWQLTTNEKVQSWDELNSGILSVFKTQDIVRNFMTVSILLVAGFGIYNVLNMLVNSKRNEIAILRSIGYNSQDVVKVFLIQGLTLGILGGIIGLILGYFVCQYLSTIEVSARRIGTTGRLMISYDVWIYIKAFSLAFISCLIASVLPARAAGKLTPIEVIRSE